MWITLQAVKKSKPYNHLLKSTRTMLHSTDCKYTVSDRGLSTYFLNLRG